MPTPPRRPSSRPRAANERSREVSATERAGRQRALLRGRLLAIATLVATAGGVTVVVAGIGSSSPSAASHDRSALGARQRVARSPGTVSTGAVGSGQPAHFAVGLTVMRLVDSTRSMSLPDGRTVPRTLVTYVRYPARGSASQSDVAAAPPARSAGPFPLIVFGHGFAVTPALYGRLLRAWARAGYVVAAPVFPLENANASGGPDESDLPNQPADMSVVISRMLAATQASSGPLSGLIATREIAVAGQSDGGDSALAVAYDPRYRDPRIGAVMILSGAEIPGSGEFQIKAGGPPLLAVQGTADPINPPSATSQFYASARAPKYRLELLGASHLPPYSSQEPQLGIVQRTTIAFLDRYLKHTPEAAQQMLSAGNVPRTATLSADP